MMHPSFSVSTRAGAFTQGAASSPMTGESRRLCLCFLSFFGLNPACASPSRTFCLLGMQPIEVPVHRHVKPLSTSKSRREELTENDEKGERQMAEERMDSQLLTGADIDEHGIRCEGTMIYDLTFAK